MPKRRRSNPGGFSIREDVEEWLDYWGVTATWRGDRLQMQLEAYRREYSAMGAADDFAGVLAKLVEQVEAHPDRPSHYGPGGALYVASGDQVIEPDVLEFLWGHESELTLKNGQVYISLRRRTDDLRVAVTSWKSVEDAMIQAIAADAQRPPEFVCMCGHSSRMHLREGYCNQVRGRAGAYCPCMQLRPAA